MSLTLQPKVFVILVSVCCSGWWYHSSWWSLHVISGTMNCTSLGTSLHSCQVTGSQASVPAHTWGYFWPSQWILGSIVTHLFSIFISFPVSHTILLGHIPTLWQQFLVRNWLLPCYAGPLYELLGCQFCLWVILGHLLSLALFVRDNLRYVCQVVCIYLHLKTSMA